MQRIYLICCATAAAICAVAIFVSSSAHCCSRANQNDDKIAGLQPLATMAVSTDVTSAEQAIERLRMAGPAGLEALFQVHAELLSRSLNNELALLDNERADWQRLESAIDCVSGQRYGHVSRLFWYTDLDQAVQAAQSRNKPILTLRLLGNLVDDYSCANSRFFRTTLYANKEVSDFLRDNFVLHWRSVRPVPKVSIDFGNGRRIQTTLTGNSIHYILSREGHPIDALPGLYGPQAFLRHLRRGAEAANHYSELSEVQRPGALIEHHRGLAVAIDASWAEDLRRLGQEVAQPKNVGVPVAHAAEVRRVPAIQAARMALPKSVIEVRTIAALVKDDPLSVAAPAVDSDWLSANTTDEVWRQIAELHASDAKLDDVSSQLMQRLQPMTFRNDPAIVAQAMASCSGFTLTKADLSGMIEGFEALVALDSVRNEYLLHRQIHRWFAESEVDGLDALNERVYSDLFLTPRSDPWLGLVTEDAFTALPNAGLHRE